MRSVLCGSPVAKSRANSARSSVSPPRLEISAAAESRAAVLRPPIQPAIHSTGSSPDEQLRRPALRGRLQQPSVDAGHEMNLSARRPILHATPPQAAGASTPSMRPRRGPASRTAARPRAHGRGAALRRPRSQNPAARRSPRPPAHRARQIVRRKDEHGRDDTRAQRAERRGQENGVTRLRSALSSIATRASPVRKATIRKRIDAKTAARRFHSEGNDRRSCDGLQRGVLVDLRRARRLFIGRRKTVS